MLFGSLARRRRMPTETIAPPPSLSEFVYFEGGMTQVQRRDGDADTQWVLKGHERAWYDTVR